MSIASRIQEIETHIGDVYDTINYSYDTTGVNKNIINIPKYLKKGYIDIINNGINNLYNNFPKVSGIGSNLSLTPTYEAPIKLNEIQGDTLQDGTPTPDTPVEIQSVTGLQNVSISNSDNTDSNTYEVNLGDIELNKIGTYQDSIKKSTGKNLFDDTYNHLGMYQTATGQIGTFAEGNQYLGAYLKVEAGKTYSISRNKLTSRFAIGVTSEIPTASTNCLAITRDDSTLKIENITIPDGYSYLILYLSNSSETSTGLNIMINEGTTALPYEPYGKVWYVEKNKRKLELAIANMNNSENYPGWLDMRQLKADYPTGNDSLYNLGIKYYSNICTQTNNFNDYFGYNSAGAGTLFLRRNIWGDDHTQTYWKTNYPNLIVTLVYNLKTPEYETITNTELINQLEALNTAKSQEGTTNISITSEDLEMILNVSALKGEE